MADTIARLGGAQPETFEAFVREERSALTAQSSAAA
jgi:hypothetical protein